METKHRMTDDAQSGKSMASNPPEYCLESGNSALALSSRAEKDVIADTNPQSAFWREAPRIVMTGNNYGQEVSGHSTEVRSRWTEANLYFLFVCPYQKLNLKPAPVVESKTDGLWNWDVAETFIGSMDESIHCYKEFEVSPQGEWLDLKIDLTKPDKIGDPSWSSGWTVAARIDAEKGVWYAAMRIPFTAIDQGKSPAVGNTLRINFFRSQGTKPVELAWQPPHQESFHAPEHFGTLRLI